MSQKEHWLSLVQPLGDSGVEVAYQRTFTPAEAEKLRAGSWPESMDDKWVIYLGESSLDLWRSWTGYCVYSLPARLTRDGVVVGPLFVNGDSAQYHRVSDQDDVQLMEQLINYALEDEREEA